MKNIKKRNLGIGAKLILKTVAILFVALAIAFGSIIYLVYQSNTDNAKIQVDTLAAAGAAKLKARLDSAHEEAVVLADIMGGYENLDPSIRRAVYNNMLKDILINNPHYIGIWSCWEPYALDGLDDQYVYSQGSDATGRFVSYWSNQNGNLMLTPLTGYDTAGAGDYYLLARDLGKATILDPYKYELDGEEVLMSTISIPIISSANTVVGVVGVDIAISDLYDIQFGKGQYDSTYTYALANDGTCVYHSVATTIVGQTVQKADPNEKMDEIIHALQAGEPYSYYSVSKSTGEDVRRVMAPVQVGETDTPWAVCVSVAENEVLAATNQMTQMMIIILIALLVVITVFMIFIIRVSITNRIKKVTDAAKEIADGNFNVHLTENSQDEVGQLSEAFSLTIDRLVNYQGYIDEMADSLMQIAKGDLTIELQRDYVGQFQKLKDNMNALLKNLNQTLAQIQQSSEQVSYGSEQVSHGAQQLSQGAIEQASSIEELSSTITEITEQVKKSAERATEASGLVEIAGKELRDNNEQMQGLLAAMSEINSKSAEISKIIKVIDDIAFQTNILALNAAVEAARAGTAGKGFSVVADEVRNLASKSAEAAKSTSMLIEETLVAVENGTQLANNTAGTLLETATKAGGTVEITNKIATDSDEQALAIEQIKAGIEQISHVVQTTAATAEESASTSEELSSQSASLNELIGEFKLQKED